MANKIEIPSINENNSYAYDQNIEKKRTTVSFTDRDYKELCSLRDRFGTKTLIGTVRKLMVIGQDYLSQQSFSQSILSRWPPPCLGVRDIAENEILLSLIEDSKANWKDESRKVRYGDEILYQNYIVRLPHCIFVEGSIEDAMTAGYIATMGKNCNIQIEFWLFRLINPLGEITTNIESE